MFKKHLDKVRQLFIILKYIMDEKIDDIMLALTKAVKAGQLYGMDHPSFRNFYTPFYQKLTDFLKMHNELNFEIEKFTFLHADRVVYEDKEKDINIAFRLFRDGVRNVGFTDGLTSDELLHLLEIISQSPKEQDIALSLWESDFTHINFYVVEEEEEVVDYRIPDLQVENIDYDATMNGIITKEKLDINAAIIPDLNFEELNSLRTEILNDEKRSILPLAITTLTNFLNADKSQEVIDSLIELFEQCIDRRDFYNARIILHKFREYSDINVIGKLENETMIMGFVNLLNIPEDEIFNEFIEFLGLFSKKSIPNFLKIIASVGREDRLYAFRNQIASIAQGDPSYIAPLLQSENITTLINAIAILAIMGLKETTSLLEPIFEHPEPKVRTQIILALEHLAQPTLIAKFLDDPSSDIRIKALQALTKVKFPDIYPELLHRIQKKDFWDIDFAEQKEYFDCLVASGDDNLTKMLKKILFKWLLFGRKKYRSMRNLAALSLAQIGNDEALEILRQGIRKQNRDIRHACEMALKEK